MRSSQASVRCNPNPFPYSTNKTFVASRNQVYIEDFVRNQTFMSLNAENNVYVIRARSVSLAHVRRALVVADNKRQTTKDNDVYRRHPSILPTA